MGWPAALRAPAPAAPPARPSRWARAPRRRRPDAQLLPDTHRELDGPLGLCPGCACCAGRHQPAQTPGSTPPGLVGQPLQGPDVVERGEHRQRHPAGPQGAEICSRRVCARALAGTRRTAGALTAGPTDPATTTGCPACCTASRASRAPAMLISETLPSSPAAASRSRFAPKVLVCTIWAPALTYAVCGSRTRAGRDRFSSGSERSSGTPAACNIAPSQTTT
jgi:hypothetical protein